MKRKLMVLCGCVMMCTVSQAALLNANFEDPELDPGANFGNVSGSSSVTDWYDSERYTWTKDASDGVDYPVTPYGDNWVELGNGRWIYQQVGTYTENITYQISFLAGKRVNSDFTQLFVQILAGGDPLLAADVNEKRTDPFSLETTVGATVVDTAEAVHHFTTDATSQTEELSVTLSTGAAATGYTEGAPLWLLFYRPADTGRALIDNVSMTVVPEPATMLLLGLGSLVALRKHK